MVGGYIAGNVGLVCQSTGRGTRTMSNLTHDELRALCMGFRNTERRDIKDMAKGCLSLLDEVERLRRAVEPLITKPQSFTNQELEDAINVYEQTQRQRN